MTRSKSGGSSEHPPSYANGDEFLPSWSGYRRFPYRSEMGGRLSAGQKGTPSFLGGLREAWLHEANLP